MRILLASPRGFCAGVNMAIETVETALQRFGTPLYVFHEIVHNQHVVQTFSKRGVIFVNDIDEVPPGSVLVFSAHGVSPEVREKARQRQLRTIDATCPLVTKVHREVRRFADQGYTIFLIGHAGHDEVIGTMGEAPDAIRLIQSVADAETVEVPDPDKVAYTTQTTLSILDAAQIVARLRERFPKLVGPAKDDICYATQNRQEAILAIARQCDVFLVVGSQNSSNSRRLAEIAASTGIPSYLVDGPQDVDLTWFKGKETVGITAGASAPERLVQECIQLLRENFGATVEEVSLREEHVHFPLPLELRLAASK
ncbi:MAG: 4-hydroxy-3-methylbut-2-enyl diphosphate reductase [Thermogutta sp.]|uniref:4-hydroxy-3-methylbut-2-enyl diphosphate reductase n=1 Tax=Thermogutta sp. TaxID=1962930 RepID=UPI0019AC5D3C|nr:4-hydroxy-3-methylbut-2-enyl diphosphate reductase [Thermogutta sp.]MBC7353034.1 4-hydroxy-3-methylbut-2-enyl diphosphate reductase [Thermogutta sp.]